MYCTIGILCLECFHCYVIIINCLLISFDMLYFSTDGCINKSLTYLLTYLHLNWAIIHPSGVCKLSTDLSDWVGGAHSLVLGGR